VKSTSDGAASRELSLPDLVQAAELTAVTEQTEWLGDALAFDSEPAGSATVRDGRVVVELIGTEAIQRYFAWHPKTATFEMRFPSGDPDQCTVPIRYE
jgi:hypothetical protein